MRLVGYEAKHCYAEDGKQPSHGDFKLSDLGVSTCAQALAWATDFYSCDSYASDSPNDCCSFEKELSGLKSGRILECFDDDGHNVYTFAEEPSMILELYPDNAECMGEGHLLPTASPELQRSYPYTVKVVRVGSLSSAPRFPHLIGTAILPFSA